MKTMEENDDKGEQKAEAAKEQSKQKWKKVNKSQLGNLNKVPFSIDCGTCKDAIK